MALLFEALFLGVFLRLLAFAAGVLIALLGLALEAAALLARYLLWPALRWVGRAAFGAARVGAHGGAPTAHAWRARPSAAARGHRRARTLDDQAAVLAGVRDALAARG